MKIQPYLFFNGRCEEAIRFYQEVLGAEITALMRYKESPDPAMTPPGAEDKIMHASVRIGDTELMASDGDCSGKPSFAGFSVALTVAGAAEAERVFNALAHGGQVQMPPAETFFSPRFGMLADRYGLNWMIMAEMPQQ
ncbi:MAG TPA: VOC family protein [Noviherbaspirillum sp.]|nr:VOC family protein [Noviherbaspirillum sp.]